MDYNKLKAQLNIDENRVSRLYKDSVGKLTGGVGHNFDDKGIPGPVIDLLLDIDVDDAVNSLDRNIPWWKNLSDARQRALCNMCFNMGINRLMGFKNMLSALQAGNYKVAAQEARNSLWAKQVGDRAERIAVLFEQG